MCHGVRKARITPLFECVRALAFYANAKNCKKENDKVHVLVFFVLPYLRAV